MRNIRLIARLDVKGAHLIKGIQLEGLRVVGNPNNFAKKYYEQGVDELLYIDSVASLYGRNNLYEIVKKTTKEVFIPVTVGGGIRKLDDIKNLLKAGADKIAINTAAIKNPDLIKKAVERFGSQSIVISVVAKKTKDRYWECYIEGGREKTGISVVEWAKRATELGSGEMLVTSVDNDGTKKGFDYELMEEISKRVNIPIIASGGAGCKNDIYNILRGTKIDAFAIGTVLHFEKLSIEEIKQSLINKGFFLRPNIFNS